MTIFGEILSLALDFSPIETFKNAIEGLSGYNMVTFEKLNDYEHATVDTALTDVAINPLSYLK